MLKKIVGLKNNQGFTLIEVMIAIGLFAVVGSAMMKTNELAMKTNVAAQVGISWQLKRFQIESALQTADGCENTMMGLSFTDPVPDIKTRNGTVVATAGTMYPSSTNPEFEITSLTLTDATAGAGPYGNNTIAEVTAVITWKKNMAGKAKDTTSVYKFPTEIAVVDATSPVTACSDAGGGGGGGGGLTTTETCDMFGGTVLDITGSGDYRCLHIDGFAGTAAISANVVSLGPAALAALTTADQTVALGQNALASATNTSGDVAVGFYAMNNIVTSSMSTAVGAGALEGAVAGSSTSNTAVGAGSMALLSSGTYNTAVGNSSLNANASGHYNVAIGEQTMVNNTSGSNNTALGSGALAENLTGAGNTIVGYTAGYVMTAASFNTLVGASSGLAMLGDQNSTLGYGTLEGNVGSTTSNVAVGAYAMNGLSAGEPQNNVAVGNYALKNAATGGTNNVAVGMDALDSILAGNGNVAIGKSAMTTSQDGVNFLIGIGYGALQLVEGTAVGVTAIGYLAMSAGASGQHLTAVGANSMRDQTSGDSNTAVGSNALMVNSTGSNNTALGDHTLYSQFTASDNTAVGHNALYSNDGINNTAVGSNSMLFNSSGTWNTAVGVNALYTNSTQVGNTAVGGNALYANQGDKNTAVGYTALAANSTGTMNVAVGAESSDTLSSGSYNTSVGSLSLGGTIDGQKNTALGYSALFTNTSGNENVAVGNGALFSNTDHYNVGIGMNALYSLSGAAGYSNASIGAYSMEAVTTGYNNVALGFNALKATVDAGNDNVFIGASAGMNATGATVTNNVVIGSGAGDALTSTLNTFIGKGTGATSTGNRNTFIGGNSGGTHTTGAYNTCVGVESCTNFVWLGDYNTILGGTAGNGAIATIKADASAFGNGSNNLEIRSGPDINYNLITGSATGTQYLRIHAGEVEVNYGPGPTWGTVSGGLYTNVSDRRLKNSIRDYENGLADIMKLKIKLYKWNKPQIDPDKAGADQIDYRKYEIDNVGVIAQDVQKIMPNAVRSTSDSMLSLDSYQLFFASIKAIQEQQKEIEENKKMFIFMQRGIEERLAQHDQEILELKEENKLLKRELASLKEMVTKFIHQKAKGFK